MITGNRFAGARDAAAPVPRRAPEIVAVLARKLGDKAPDTSLRELVVDGVTLESRYRRADEFDRMQRMVRGLPPDVRGKIATVFCDSQFGDSYSVGLRPTATRADALSIGDLLQRACLAEVGGHNSISVEGAFGWVVLDPTWIE